MVWKSKVFPSWEFDELSTGEYRSPRNVCWCLYTLWRCVRSSTDDSADCCCTHWKPSKPQHCWKPETSRWHELCASAERQRDLASDGRSLLASVLSNVLADCQLASWQHFVLETFAQVFLILSAIYRHISSHILLPSRSMTWLWSRWHNHRNISEPISNTSGQSSAINIQPGFWCTHRHEFLHLSLLHARIELLLFFLIEAIRS